MYNIHEYYSYKKVSNYLFDCLYKNYNNYYKEKLSNILDKDFNKKRLEVRDNSIEVTASAISSIIAFLILGEFPKNPSKVPEEDFYYKISRSAVLKMGCSQNNKDYYIKLDVGDLEIVLFGKPDIFCGSLPGEIKSISSSSPEETKRYQIIRGILQARMYGFILGLQKSILGLVYYRRYGDNFHIERIKQETIDVDKKEIENMVRFVVSKIIIPYLY